MRVEGSVSLGALVIGKITTTRSHHGAQFALCIDVLQKEKSTTRKCRNSPGYLEPKGSSGDRYDALRLSRQKRDMHNGACKTIPGL